VGLTVIASLVRFKTKESDVQKLGELVIALYELTLKFSIQLIHRGLVKSY
jgi:hypothetical protein